MQAYMQVFLPNLFAGMHYSWAWRWWPWNTNQLSWVPLPFRTLSHGTPPSRSLRRAKSALLKLKVVGLLCILLSEVRHFMFIAAKASPLGFTFPTTLLVRMRSSITTLFVVFFINWRKEIIINAFQEAPGLSVSCCVIPLTGVRVVEVPHENQGLWGSSYLPHPLSLPGQVAWRRPPL